MSESVLLIDIPAPHVARLRINRPSKRNAIDHAVREAFIVGIQELQEDTDVRALVLGGIDGIFSAGGDVPSMVGLNEGQARERMQHIHVLCHLISSLPIPVVSAVEGVAAGAAVGMALLGDHIVVGTGTKILFPFLRLGLAPDWGQLLTLPRRVGIGPARRILTSAKPLSGEEALAIGLADELVSDTQVMEIAVTRAEELARLPREAFARTKQRLSNPSATLAEELLREETDQAVCLLSDEFKEGFAAFTEKRSPNFIRGSGQ